MARTLRRRPSGAGAPRAATKSREPSRMRVLILLAASVLLASAVWGKLAYWQVWQHNRLSTLANIQHVDSISLPATRGVIYDDQGRPLALNTTVYDVTLSPQTVLPSQRSEVANGLASVLGVNADTVQKELASGRVFYYVAHRIPMSQAQQLQRMSLPGVAMQGVPQRVYVPGGISGDTLAANLLGFVDYSGEGDRGVEQDYNRQLAGVNGEATLYRDSDGQPIAATMQNQRKPVNGSSITLTLDSDLQYEAEQAIQRDVELNHAQSGSAIIMDTHTGGIVGYATYPSYNANDFYDYSSSQTQDGIASDLYEPGSVMKVVTMAGAINSGAMTPNTVIYDPGYITVQGQQIHDWDDAYMGNITMTKVLEESLNVGAIRAEQLEGKSNFLHYLQAFGFGQPTGAGVGEEANVPLPAASQWSPVQLATASFGQGIDVNMIQMVAAINAIANGGVYVQPHVVEKVGNKPFVPQERRVVSPQTAALVNQMMRSVVQHGSGYMARVPGFQLDEAGKTGQSQIPINGQYSLQWYWASYVGFMPASNPQFTMLINVTRPNNGSILANDGYIVAGPTWATIAEDIVRLWHLTPSSLPPTPN